MNLRIRTWLGVACLIAFAFTSAAQRPVASPAPAKIERTYQTANDQTTVRLTPVRIAGEQGKYRSVQISPAFSFAGTTLRETPALIDFEVLTVVNGRLNTDLYVVFVIDGETVFLSSNRSAIKRPVPGRVWVGERLVFRMPYETFVRITKAKTFALKFDGTLFPVNDSHLKILQDFLKETTPPDSAMPAISL